MTPALFAAIFVTTVGALILWSNPQRIVNRIVFSCSLHLALWLACLHLAKTSGAGIFWVRWACVVGASVPIHFWAILQEGLTTERKASIGHFLRGYYLWIVITVAQTLLPLTEFFIPEKSTATNKHFGPGYSIYIAVAAGLYVFLMIGAILKSRKLTGGLKLELQVWLLGGCTMTMLLLLLMVLNLATDNAQLYVHTIQPIVVMVFYGATAVAITTGRIFDARQAFLVVTEKGVLVGSIAGLAYAADYGFKQIISSEWFAWVSTTALVLWFGRGLNRWLNRRLQLYPEATEARKAVFDASKAELKVEGLEQAFLPILQGWGHSEHALLLSGPKEEIKGGGITLPPNLPMIDALRRMRWATPERLAREKSSPERDAIGQFLVQHRLGILICSRGLTLTVLVGVGIPVTRRPFTYPQVEQLIELTEIMGSALERAHFSLRAQQAERLATVGLLGTGVAHEIRNPLVTIKTFVQLLPQRHNEEGFRRKFFQLISEEINRIDRLTERLMELGSPRSYFMVAQPLHALLRGTLELVEPKAADHGVEIVTDFRAGPDVIDTDAAAARQVLLNLCLNAVHAMAAASEPRRLRLTTRNVPGGIEVSVNDSGPGLASEMIPRLFTPFQSTKSTGFGLGLAISSEIMSGLKGTIAADPPRAGEGATFRLIFPCPSPSS